MYKIRLMKIYYQLLRTNLFITEVVGCRNEFYYLYEYIPKWSLPSKRLFKWTKKSTEGNTKKDIIISK